MVRGRRAGTIWEPPRSHTDREYAERREETFRALRELEDRRRWHPEKPLVPPATLEGRAARRIVERTLGGFVKTKPLRFSFDPGRLGFAIPDKVVLCLRRKQRREVIHAKKLAGRGARAKHRLRNWWSDIVCR